MTVQRPETREWLSRTAVRTSLQAPQGLPFGTLRPRDSCRRCRPSVTYSITVTEPRTLEDVSRDQDAQAGRLPLALLQSSGYFCGLQRMCSLACWLCFRVPINLEAVANCLEAGVQRLVRFESPCASVVSIEYSLLRARSSQKA
jgi:hypothetical protein